MGSFLPLRVPGRGFTPISPVREHRAPAKTIVSGELHTGWRRKTLRVYSQRSCQLRADDFDLSSGAGPSLRRAVRRYLTTTIHDTFVRDGYAFVFAWTKAFTFSMSGMALYEARHHPVQLITRSASAAKPQRWWFWNPMREAIPVYRGGRTVQWLHASGDTGSGRLRPIAPVEVALPYQMLGPTILGG
jgi:hypothetical protein